MPDKAYAVLFDHDSGYMYFPIKRAGLVYGGMPQFFGGTKNAGESDRDCISREMGEESDGNLSLASGGLSRVFKTTVGGSSYTFYVSTSYTGKPTVGPLKNPEMQALQSFYVDEHGDDTIEDLLQRLKITATAEFMQSETYAAFDPALAFCAGGAVTAAAAEAEEV